MIARTAATAEFVRMLKGTPARYRRGSARTCRIAIVWITATVTARILAVFGE